MARPPRKQGFEDRRAYAEWAMGNASHEAATSHFTALILDVLIEIRDRLPAPEAPTGAAQKEGE